MPMSQGVDAYVRFSSPRIMGLVGLLCFEGDQLFLLGKEEHFPVLDPDFVLWMRRMEDEKAEFLAEAGEHCLGGRFDPAGFHEVTHLHLYTIGARYLGSRTQEDWSPGKSPAVQTEEERLSNLHKRRSLPLTRRYPGKS